MNRVKKILLIMAAVVLACAGAFAHNGIEHLMGAVTVTTIRSITVNTVQHTTVTVTVDDFTKFTYKGVKASLKDLKAGERVVIDAKEGADKKLLGISVKWGASSGATPPHADHKM